MKFSFSSILIVFLISASAQVSEIFLLKTVLTDSIINEYTSDLCGIENNAFVLFHNSGNYAFNNGIVEFEERKCDTTYSFKRAGTLKKIKLKKNKAIVKIYFTGNNNFYARVKLQQDVERKPWRIKSRFLYRNFQIPKKEPQLLYYSLH